MNMNIIRDIISTEQIIFVFVISTIHKKNVVLTDHLMVIKHVCLKL